MKIKLDENVTAGARAPLQRLGHDVSTVPDEGMAGFSDETIWPVIQREDRFLITQDKGFADLRRHPPGSHHGILLLRPSTALPDGIVAFLAEVLEIVSLDDLRSCVAVANSRGVRIRRPPGERG